jgi:hypothetical protein
LPVRIDHVIYATADLEAAAAQIEAQLGLAAVAGGRHEGLGTHNRIVPLGGGYLELLAVGDPDEAARSVFGSAMVAHLQRHGDGLAGWAVAVEDVAEVAARLGTSISTIAREGLRAELAGLAEALRKPFLPFFLSRNPGVLDPGAAGEAGGITWIEVAGDATRLEQWLDGAQLPVRTVDGTPRVRAVGIGEGELRTG